MKRPALRRKSPPRRKRGLRATKGPRRGKKLVRVNVARRRRNFARSYGSRERVRWVKALPCVVLGCRDPSLNCHTGRGGGMGYKGPSTEVFPACPRHHDELHQYGPGWFLAQYGISQAMLYDAAEATEVAWRAHGGEYGL